jgi:hypothetical protein
VKVTQLTIRLEPELARRIRQVAKTDGLSLGEAALTLLRRGAGMAGDTKRPVRVGQSLDSLAGTWTEHEERELLKTLELFEHVDESLWR